MKVIKVGSSSKISAVAGSIAHSLREDGYTAAQGIGASAVNQMIKATIIAKRFLAEEDSVLTFTPDFAMVEINGAERTAVRLLITATKSTSNGAAVS